MRALGIRTMGVAATLLAAAAAAGSGCGGGTSDTSASTGGSSSPSSTTATTSSSTGTGGKTASSTTTTASSTTSTTSSTTGAGGTAGTGGSTTACTTTAVGQRRGSAIALTSDGSTLISVNRDAGSVTVTSVTYPASSPNDASLTQVKEIPVGNEPWQVIIDGCDETAYVVLRQDQKVVQIKNLKTAPAVGASVAVGSEPTSLALTPNNTKLYVSNWVDGNLSVVDPASMTVTATIDLNATIAGTGLLGPDVEAAPRAGLAHPRGIAVTNNGDASDDDETVYVTEWFAVRTGPEMAGNAINSDTDWKGLLYQIPVMTGTPALIDLPPVTSTGFNDAKGNATGCFPNQVASVTIDNEGTNAAPQYYAYVTSTCASPAGPTGVFQFGACQITANCSTFGGSSTCDLTKGVCTGSCTTDAQCGVGSAVGACNVATGECAPLTANAKTTTHPGLTIVDLTGATPSAVTTSLDTSFTSTTLTQSKTASTRMPLLPTDVDFKPGFAYVASEGADALFRLTVSGGKITAVGSTATSDFVDLHLGSPATVRLPIGVAVNQNTANPVAFVANDGTRTITAVNLSVQAASTSATGEIASSTAPAAGSPAASVLNGKRFFNTGLGRWSLNGAAWGSCGACHVDGLTDDVTWYFARGPRQTTSLDGTFGKHPPTGVTVDQRILNWTAVNDEIADFETNVRGISGGVGAIVSTVSNPPAVTDRVNLVTSVPPQTALEGSSTAAAAAGAVTNWADITNYVAQIRSPRAVSAGLFTASDVTAGQALFAAATCNGCHSGDKWTISTVFYTPGNVPNDAFGSVLSTSLGETSWLAGAQSAHFPTNLFPSTAANAKTFMRSGAPTGFEQIQCILRPVGTITANGAVPTGVSPAAVNVLELRQDMLTGAQGAGGTNANDFTTGFNVPSLLGLQVGAPYFHAGNARSLEEMFNNAIFTAHYQALGAVFTPTPTTVKQMVAYLLSIDGNATFPPLPAAPSAEGGDICHYP